MDHFLIIFTVMISFLDQTSSWLTHTAKTVQYLHKCGIHGDLKSTIFLIAAENVLRLCDFFLRLSTESTSSETKARGHSYHDRLTQLRKGSVRFSTYKGVEGRSTKSPWSHFIGFSKAHCVKLQHFVAVLAVFCNL